MHRFPIISYISIVDYFLAFKYPGRLFQDLSCKDFYTLILKKPKLLKEICSSWKYGTSAQKEEPTTSTSDGN
jgi:hypothetical protein